jgi:hypothetical protein
LPEENLRETLPATCALVLGTLLPLALTAQICRGEIRPTTRRSSRLPSSKVAAIVG